ncbi:MAG: hypothetical protein NC098_09175 [Lachnoclostridium sp.]|nr:hypothetical protein [Lachnoclostridium sp.]
MIITPDTLLSAVIIRDTEIIPLINRLGIRLGTADMTVDQVAEAHDLNPQFLLCIINTFTNDNYFPETALRKVDISTMIQYLELTDRYYLHFKIPNIERHFNALLSSNPENSSLSLLHRLFDKAKTDLKALVRHDLDTLFPAIVTGNTPASLDDTPAAKVEEMFADLLSMIVKHISGPFDDNLCYATIVAVQGLLSDLRKNNRLRNLIFLPAAQALNHQ